MINIGHSITSKFARTKSSKLWSLSVASFGTQDKGLFTSFFHGLQKMGVGKQFELDSEKVLWGNNSERISNIGTILSSSGSAAPTTLPPGSLINKWEVFNDKEYGGQSDCEVVVNSKSSIVSFSGCVHEPAHNRGDGDSTSRVSGYCALTGYCASEIDLMNFAGIEILLRTSKPCNFLFRYRV